MSYYTVLEMTNALVVQQGWSLQRCRRRCDGPARYVICNQIGTQILIDSSHKARRLGFTLMELLMWLGKHEDAAIAAPAGDLLDQLILLVEYE